MRFKQKNLILVIVASTVLLATLLHYWTSKPYTTMDVRPRLSTDMEKFLEEKLGDLDISYASIPYQLKESVAGLLPQNGCVCKSDKTGLGMPLAGFLFPHVVAQDLHEPFQKAELEKMKQHRAQEYHRFRLRFRTSADLVIVAEANSPLQYPTQGVKVRPLKTIRIPGLVLKEKPRHLHSVNLTATLGTFDVAATVEGVRITGEGSMHMVLSSSLLTALNRQLQFITYTNTLFQPKTADAVIFETEGHQSVFTIKIGYSVTPRLYNPDPSGEYNINSLVTIVTKTFLRYEKLQNLVDSIRQYYPNITIVIADDNENPQLLTGPHIEQYIMPFKKGWFAGRNLAVSQATTKYVLWVDDDFIFTANTNLEKLVDVLEKTTLDLVGGAVREVTGYTATFRHTFSLDEGAEDGDCLHMRKGFHHVIEGFPNCVVADAVINFFMGRTDMMRRVGFDPRLARTAHLEFFIDGLGSLHVGSCDDVIVNHASKIKLPWGQSENEKAYANFRYPKASPKDARVRNDLFYFKNGLKCLTRD